MQFTPGNPGGPGRPRGVANQTTLALRAHIESRAGGPLPEILVQIALEARASGDLALAIAALAAASKYLYPTLKSVEVTMESVAFPVLNVIIGDK